MSGEKIGHFIGFLIEREASIAKQRYHSCLTFYNVLFQDQNTGNGYIDQTIPQRDVEEMISMQPNVSKELPRINVHTADGQNLTEI